MSAEPTPQVSPDIAADWLRATLIDALPDAPEIVRTGILDTGNAELSKVWEGNVPEEVPEGAIWEKFYPAIVFVFLTPIYDLYAVANDQPGAQVLTTLQYEVKVIGDGTGYRALRPFAYWLLQTLDGADGYAEGGAIDACVKVRDWPRLKETTSTGRNLYHSGYTFDILVHLGEDEE